MILARLKLLLLVKVVRGAEQILKVENQVKEVKDNEVKVGMMITQMYYLIMKICLPITENLNNEINDQKNLNQAKKLMSNSKIRSTINLSTSFHQFRNHFHRAETH